MPAPAPATSEVAAFERQLDPALMAPPPAPQSARVESPVGVPPAVPAPVAAEPDGGVHVTGCVRDEDGVPFTGLELVLMGLRGARGLQPAATTRTSDDGRFRLGPVARGAWALQSTGGGTCEPLRRELDLTRGDLELELTARRGLELCVQARWPEGSPVHALSVTHRELLADGTPGRAGGASTAGGGEDCLKLGGFCPGEYELRVSSTEDGRSGLATVRVRLPAPGPLLIVLDENLVELRGRVVDPAGAPIQGASVRVSPEVAAPVSPTTTTAADGSFRLPGLEAGPGALLVQHERFLSPEFGNPLGGKLELTLGMAPLELVLQPKPLVRGRVVDARGAPVARAQVAGAGSLRPVPSAEDGLFELYGEPGTRSLYAQKKGHATSATLSLELALGQLVDGVVLELRPACRVSGRVLGPDGAPVPGASVLVGRGKSTRSDEQGAFVLEGLPPERVCLQAYDDDGGFASLWVTPRTDQVTELELALPARDPVAFELTLTRGGEPVRASVTLQATSFLRTGTVDPDTGRLALQLQAPGRWRGLLALGNTGPDDLAAYRLLEFDVPRQASWSLARDWDDLAAPTSREELLNWLSP